METLAPSFINLYSEFLSQLLSAEALRNIGDLRGTFVAKKLKGKNYWYLQVTEIGHQRQIYLGPETATLLDIIQNFGKQKKLKTADEQNRMRMVTMLQKGGGMVPDPLTGRILLLLSDAGLFRLGGVLIGTHAFLAYATMLGIKWPSVLKTQDIDLAQDAGISLALSQELTKIDLPHVLEQAQLGFLPVPALNLRHPSTSFKILGKETHLDLLTPLFGKETGKPVQLPALGGTALPLRYLDYLIEEPVDVAILYGSGVLAKVPGPARFALHKLIVFSERGAAQQTKAKKDLLQARWLIEILAQDRPGDLMEAWETLKKKGPGWVKKVSRGLKVLKQSWASLVPILDQLGLG